MTNDMAYLIGMVLGNGEILRKENSTIVTIEFPHKNLYTDDQKDAKVYVKASLSDIRDMVNPLLGTDTIIRQTDRKSYLSFEKNNGEYVIRELLKFIQFGTSHENMKMDDSLFDLATDQRKMLLRGFADTTAYIRNSNCYFGNSDLGRVYIEIPRNWDMAIDICNMLKSVDVPVQTLDFGHPNMRDPKLTDYNKGKKEVWRREHQLKIYSNEFLPIGFEVIHKQQALLKSAQRLQAYYEKLGEIASDKTHRYYWETRTVNRKKPGHPEENSQYLPQEIRDKHYDSWKMIAEDLGYYE